MNIPVVDYSSSWIGAVAEGVARWNTALASRGITLGYERGIPGSFAECDKGYNTIRVCDSLPRVYDHLADGWQWDSGPWDGGYVHLYGAPPAGREFAIAIVVHELGHNLGLKHLTPDMQIPSVMTPVPSLAYPSSWDTANAMPGYPLADPPVPPTQPPKDKRKKHKKKGGKR